MDLQFVGQPGVKVDDSIEGDGGILDEGFHALLLHEKAAGQALLAQAIAEFADLDQPGRKLRFLLVPASWMSEMSEDTLDFAGVTR